MSHAARAWAQGATPWPSDAQLVRLFRRLGSQTAVARSCGKSREALRDYLRLRPRLRARVLGEPTRPDELSAHREARRQRVAGLRLAQEWTSILAGDPCSYCGAPTEVSDHIQPRSKGGTDLWDNFTGSCLGCNSSKGARTLLVFLLERARGVECPVQQQQDQQRGSA